MELIDGSLFRPHLDGYGAPDLALLAHEPERAGVGIVVPNDFVIDHELWRWVPDEVTLHLTRLPVTITEMTDEAVGALADAAALRQAAESLLVPSPRVVAYACSSGSFLHGTPGEHLLVDAMVSGGAPDALTTSGAMIRALQHVGASRVALVTPYLHTISARLRDFLGEHDIDVVAEHSLGLDRNIWSLSSMDIFNAVQEADHAGADAIFVSCTNLRTYDVIAPLERMLGKPVLTANQATMWAAVRAAGHDALDPGHFLRAPSPELPEAA